MEGNKKFAYDGQVLLGSFGAACNLVWYVGCQRKIVQIVVDKGIFF